VCLSKGLLAGRVFESENGHVSVGLGQQQKYGNLPLVSCLTEGNAEINSQLPTLGLPSTPTTIPFRNKDFEHLFTKNTECCVLF